MDDLLELHNLSLFFGKKHVLDSINLNICPQEQVALVGPSGSGKSSLIKLVAGLMEPDGGEIICRGKSMALAFQSGALFTSMTVEENIALVLSNRRLNRKEIDKRIDQTLDTVGLGKEKNTYPSHLSGGMQKRVGIARALAVEPDILLYDEPSAGLDPIMANRLEQDLFEINQSLKMTTIIVTHELSTIANMARRVVMLYKGNFVFDDSVDTFFNSNDPYAVQYRNRSDNGPIKV